MNVVGDFEAILGLSSPVNHWHLLDKCGQLEMFSVWRVQAVRELVKHRRIFFFIHNNIVFLHIHIYRDSRDPTIKLFL